MDYQEMSRALSRAIDSAHDLRFRTSSVLEVMRDIQHSEIEPEAIRESARQAEAVVAGLLSQISELRYWAYEGVTSSENFGTLMADNMKRKIEAGIYFGGGL